LSQRFVEPDSAEALVEEPVDARRYVEALRRHAGLIIGLAVVVAVLVFLISLALPKTYSATAQIAPSVQATTSAASDSQSTQLNLATLQAYVTSPTVLATAARGLGGVSEASLQQNITTSLDSSANIVNITVQDSSAARAAHIANAVARTFLNVRTASEQAQLAQQVTSLTTKMNAARVAGSPGLVAALQQQISSVVAQEASAGSDLQLLAPASVPSTASSPRPTRTAFFAFVAVLFIGVLAVGARELIAPSISGGRELTALMGMPILGRVPRVATDDRVRRNATDPAEAEAYRFLARSLELSSWPNSSRLIAVTSATRGEGKTTVVSRLGAAFAETGSRTLLVSADLRRPELDRVFGLRSDGGLSVVLGNANGHRGTQATSDIEPVDESLYILPSGPPPADPAAGVTSDVVASLFERLRKLDFEYVLFDLPPLIAAAETQLFVRHADAALLASMVGRASTDELAQTRDLLNRLPVWPAGIVVLGVGGTGRLAPRNVVHILGRPDDGDRKDAQSAPAGPEKVASLAALSELRKMAVFSERSTSPTLTEPALAPDPPATAPPEPQQTAPKQARTTTRRPARREASPADPAPPGSESPSGDQSPPASPAEPPPPR
jgi:tyrosine-protein kinase